MNKLGLSAVALCALTLASASTSAQELGTSDRCVMTLDEAEEILLAENRTLLISNEAVEQAALLEEEAIGRLLPTISLTAAYTLNDSQDEFSFGNPFAPLDPYLQSVYANDPALQADPTVPDPSVLTQGDGGSSVVRYRHDYFIRGSINQVLWNAQAIPALRRARLAELQATNQLDELEYEWRGILTDFYFTALGIQRVVEIAQRNLERAQLDLDRAVAAFEEQVGLQFEVNRAQVTVSSAERELQTAMLSYELALGSVRVVLGREENCDVVPPEELPLPDADLDAWIEEAWMNRSDLASLELAIEGEEIDVDIAQGDWQPIVGLELVGQANRPTDFGASGLSWYLQLYATWDIYVGGQRDVAVEREDYDVLMAELQLEDQMVRVQSDVQRAFLNIETQRLLVETATAEVALAGENLELVQSAYELDVATQLDVDMARNQLFLSELALADAETQLQARIYELHRVVGR